MGINVSMRMDLTMILTNNQAVKFIKSSPRFKVQFTKEGREFFYARDKNYPNTYFIVYVHTLRGYIESYKEKIETFLSYAQNTDYISRWWLAHAPADFNK